MIKWQIKKEYKSDPYFTSYKERLITILSIKKDDWSHKYEKPKMYNFLEEKNKALKKLSNLVTLKLKTFLLGDHKLN